jgi:alkylation response protein AidB-like acyl-CoA dehydrogenase
MDFDESAEDAVFRAEVRSWFSRPEVAAVAAGTRLQGLEQDEGWFARAKVWQRFLADNGWACITWPETFGGRGGTGAQAAIFAEESMRAGVLSGAFAVGVSMAGPTIIAHGSDAQKQRYLPPMARADEVWCQLFSEPGAGSDLAGLSTRAVRDGDEWIVNGQKVWTSGARQSDLGMLLARTDPDQPKHRGITWFVLDMRSPGIEIRPLRQITGASHFNEVFLTDVRVPDAAAVGGLNAGWGVAMTTLANERTFIGGSGRALGFHELVTLARTHGVAGQPVVRQELAASFIRSQLARYLGLRIRTMTARGRSPHAEASIGKLVAAQNLKRNAELALAIEGAGGALAGADAPVSGAWQQAFLSAPSIRIAGGSDEVQRNVIGERVLGLPGEPRLDKDLPFRELPVGGVAAR